ncbi:hypothetical protein FJY63_00540 [Candidatus Sumerlaeota bacterium]|nr:hypothetical protein [Candidatus Sumerlaeota bacterium]
MSPDEPQQPEQSGIGYFANLFFHHGAATVVALAAHVALTLAVYREAFLRIEGKAFALLGDDAFISMVYGRALAHQGQLVWSDGQRIEGFSNLLWTLIMAATHVLPLPERLAALPILALNVFLVALSALLAAAFAAKIVAEIGHPVAVRAVAAVAAAGCVLLNFSYVQYAAAGSEGPLAAVFLLLGWDAWTRTRTCTDGARTFTDGARKCAVFLVLASLTRAEIGFFLCGLLALAALRAEWRSRAVRVLPIAVVALAALGVWRWTYFGDWLPNTYYLKVSGFPHRWINGLRCASEFMIGGGGVVLLVFALTTWRGSPSARIAVFCTIFFVMYVAYLGGDAFELHRLYAPIFPLLAAAAAGGVAHAAARLDIKPRTGVAFGLLLLVVTTNADSAAAVEALANRRLHRLPNPPAERLRQNIILAKWLNENTPRDARIAVFMAGAMAYFCERPVVDMLGKCEAHIAHLPAGHGRIPGHNKYDFAYVVGTLRPDYIVGERVAPPVGSAPPQSDSPLERDFGFVNALAYNTALQRDYKPLPAPYPYSDLRTVYVRGDR